ncbi:MAG: iron-containing alcohol dehydrogenase family protein [Peptococcia bacterium]|jgi:alcohol dehydrogenase class IV
MQFTLHFPSKLIFGDNTLDKLGENAIEFGKKCLLVTGKKSTRESGTLQKTMESLTKNDIKCLCFSEVSGEPDCEIVDRVRTLAEKEKVDFLVALGGGSSLDTAKAAAGLMGQDLPTVEYLNKAPFEYKGIPFVAVPTTAGTGSEITLNSVLYNPVTENKKSLAHPCFQARLSIVDPTLTYSMLPRLTAITGMDALTHAVESYTSLKANEVTKALAARAIKIICENLRATVENNLYCEGRSKMALGSMMAGMAFAQTGVGAAHSLSHPLGALFHIPHGVACALLLPEVVAFNSVVCRDKYEEITVMLGLKEDFSAYLHKIVKQLPLPQTLTEAGYREGREKKIVTASFDSRSIKNNPRKVEKKDVMNILVRCL